MHCARETKRDYDSRRLQLSVRLGVDPGHEISRPASSKNALEKSTHERATRNIADDRSIDRFLPTIEEYVIHSEVKTATE